MKIYDDLLNPNVAQHLRAGHIGVIRTDTLYGLVCLANNQQAVERIFTLKGRDGNKSPILLIGSIEQLFDVPNQHEVAVLNQVWPGKTSVIVNSSNAPIWIERGNDTVAYRLPDLPKLHHLVSEIGPLIAPSANPQAQPPALSVQEAVNYFGENVDFYVDDGNVTDTKPSTLIRVNTNGSIEHLR